MQQSESSTKPSLSPLDQLLPQTPDGKPPRYAESHGLNKVLALAHICLSILAAPYPAEAGHRRMPFSQTTRRLSQGNGSAPPSPSGRRPSEIKPGDWSCIICGYSNYAARRNCYKCLALHPNELMMQPTMYAPQMGSMESVYGQQMPGMWNVPQPMWNNQQPYPLRMRPFRPMPYYQQSSASPASPAYSDRAQVGSYQDETPMRMMMSAPPAPRAQQNGTDPRAQSTGSQSPAASTPSETAVAGSDWNPTASGYSTPHSPGSLSDFSGQPQFSPPRLTQKVLPGDWICVCGINNFSSRTECVSCKSPQRMSIGTIAVPMPQFSTYGRPMMPMPMAYGINPATGMPILGQMIPMQAYPGYQPESVARAPEQQQHNGSKPRPSDRPGDWNCPNMACKYQ